MTEEQIKNQTPRTALAESLSAELDEDITPEFLAAIDRVLVQLFLRGFIVAPAHR